jgi:diadenosine tetraphosphate (Ap4A) HIT family hydrolase
VNCPLCAANLDDIVWQDEYCRVILVTEPDYPGYCRVIWGEHIAEMSDLPTSAQRHLMDVVLATECSLRALMHPDKINLASLGNMVPHLHWHVIARFAGDRHFPESIWGREQRTGQPPSAPGRAELAGRIALEITRLAATC